jgi:protein-S-isoprenylcysteine O-methyltransferase Ste14
MNQRLMFGLLALLLLLPASTAFAQDAAQTFTTPSTTDYLALGLAVVALILGIWAVRLFVRFRTLKQDEATLEALDPEDTN